MLNLSQRLKAVLEPFVASGAVVGVVALVADREGVLGEAALGYADLAARRPMQMDTLFWIASQSKPLTATGLMLLVDEGLVSVDDPASKYLPDFAAVRVRQDQGDGGIVLSLPRREITIRDLLSHTSGLPFRSEVEEPTLDMLPLETAVQSYTRTPLHSQPGPKYEYSNAGINTVGRIIEVVSGMEYSAFMNERLLTPLGMWETTFRPTPQQLTRLAKAYDVNADKTGYDEAHISQLHYPLDDPTRQPMPAGGYFSTAAEIASFSRMILNGGRYGSRRLLSEDAVREMTTRQTPPEMEASYGLGWNIGDNWFGHDGAHSTAMRVYPNAGRVTHFLVQHGGFVADGSACRAAFDAAALDDV